MVERAFKWLDARLHVAPEIRKAMRKAFPDHWSFMLGEINVYAFVVLVITGTFLALFFQASAASTTYHGSYALLDRTPMSYAFASALGLSFDVNGGLLVRQMHHWAALIFIAGIFAHMARVFFTGAFRKPREINWVVGLVLLLSALAAGFSGYSLPDDMLSGTGLRIADSVALSIPVVGQSISYLLLGGVFPSERLLPRLFVAHVYLIPAAIAALMGLHLAVVWRQKHSQFPGPGRTETNVVGSPLYPRYALKSVALLFAVVATIATLGALVQINPIWLWGPYRAWQVASPAQPDWYVGWLDGALRIGPPLALHFGPFTIPSPFWPGVVLPALLFSLLFTWPWIEGRLHRDAASHQLLDVPREVPLRTSFGAALAVFAAGLTLAGSGDVQARYVHQSIVTITHFYQAFCLVGPLAAFAIAYGFALDLRRRHGVHQAPRTRLRRNAAGGFDEERLR